MPAPVTEPDRFLLAVSGRALGAVTGADMQKLRASFAAVGIHSTKADHVVKVLQKRGGTYAWSAAAPDANAVQRRNLGYLLTLAGEHKDTASVLARSFPLMGNGAGGPAITGLTVPATFKSPA